MDFCFVSSSKVLFGQQVRNKEILMRWGVFKICGWRSMEDALDSRIIIAEEKRRLL